MAQVYRFGAVEVRPDERQLLVAGKPAPVGARAFDVLLALIDHRDRVVTKDELLDRVWPGLVVEENNLQVQVSALRKVLGPRSVSTIPGHGYRFTLEPDAVPAERPAAPRHNLPPQLDRFVGREDELCRVALLLERSRLVTLTGPGGTGKTRLTIQLARTLPEPPPGGTWFVELAPVSEGARVAQAAAFALGVAEEAGEETLDAIARHVAHGSALVILDNCEHVLEAAAELARRLLTAGPGVKVLASSREPLRVAGEVTYAVPTMGEAEASRLFFDRAEAAQPALEATDADRACVAEICRRLDGIPLAIELAAARVRALSLAKIAERLDDRFRLLTGGAGQALPRQKTLLASIEWSHELLTPEERAVLRRLAAFHGGWTLEGAEAVCSGGEVERAAVLELLSRLVEKSLVQADARVERYGLLETVRQYAREQLEASGETAAVRQRHLAFYVALGQLAHPQLHGPDQARWLERLDQERANVLAAHAWCDAVPEGAEQGLRLVSSIKLYWFSRGLLSLTHGMMVQALARAPERSRERCRVLFDVGQAGCFMGRYAEAKVHLEESLDIARELDDMTRVAGALQPLGMACMGCGDLAAARRHFEEGVALARTLDEPRGLAAALNALAQLHRVEGDLDAAEPLYEQVLGIARGLGDQESVAIGLLNLAMVTIARCDATRSRRLLAEAHTIAASTRSQVAGQSALEVGAGLAALCGAWECAARWYGAAEAQAARTGVRRDPSDEAFLAPWMGVTAAAIGAPAYAAAEAAGRALAFGDALAQAREWLVTG